MLIDLVKLLALLCMLVDHLSVVLWPDVWAARMIGRVAMPSFAVLVGWHVVGSRDPGRYIARLGAWALLAQPFYVLVFDRLTGSVLVTLALGACLAHVLAGSRSWLGRPWVGLALGVVLACLGLLDGFTGLWAWDYGLRGVGLVVAAAAARRSVPDGLWLWACVFVSGGLLQGLFGPAGVLVGSLAAVLALAACRASAVPSVASRRFLPPSVSPFFYAFFPFHLFVLLLISGA